MIRFLVIIAALTALQGCSSNQPATGRIAREPDTMCVNDCLGTGGTREFCQSRCSD
jgi:hypothetical protein